MNLIVSKGHHGAVLTVVDRKSKHVWLTALSGKAAAETTRALIRLLESITNSVNDYRRLRQGVRGACWSKAEMSAFSAKLKVRFGGRQGGRRDNVSQGGKQARPEEP